MNFWNRLICLFKGHQTSLFPGIGAPVALQWTYPGRRPVPNSVIVSAALPPAQPDTRIGIIGHSRSVRAGPGIHAVGGVREGVVAHTGATYNLDLCPRCFTLYATLPPPLCKHCYTERELHKENCDLPCQNCQKPLEDHLDGKCLFDASSYKGSVYAVD